MNKDENTYPRNAAWQPVVVAAKAGATHSAWIPSGDCAEALIRQRLD
jgi:hypothetical protein